MYEKRTLLRPIIHSYITSGVVSHKVKVSNYDYKTSNNIDLKIELQSTLAGILDGNSVMIYTVGTKKITSNHNAFWHDTMRRDVAEVKPTLIVIVVIVVINYLL